MTGRGPGCLTSPNRGTGALTTTIGLILAVPPPAITGGVSLSEKTGNVEF